MLNVKNDFDVCNETAEIVVGQNIFEQRTSDFKVRSNHMCLIGTCRRARHIRPHQVINLSYVSE